MRRCRLVVHHVKVGLSLPAGGRLGKMCSSTRAGPDAPSLTSPSAAEVETALSVLRRLTPAALREPELAQLRAAGVELFVVGSEAEVARVEEDADGASKLPFWRTRLWWAKFWVVATGIWWGICMQLLYYQGASAPDSALPNVDWYLGMMIVYLPRLLFCRPRPKGYDAVRQVHMVPIAVADVLGTIGTTVGLELAGSAIFGIIMGSITVWTALFTWLIMGQRQSAARVRLRLEPAPAAHARAPHPPEPAWAPAAAQLVGIVTVVAGLSLPMAEYRASEEGGGMGDVAIGIGLVLGGTFFYALEYALCERVYTLYAQPLDAKELCFYTGMWGMVATLFWIGCYTVPRWDAVVTEEVAAASGDARWILLLYASHTLNNAVHNLAWFNVCELEGGVTTGLLQGVKAALLFVASSAAFCSDEHPEQCYTLPKLGATATVLAGTLLYYASCPARCQGRRQSPRRREPIATELPGLEEESAPPGLGKLVAEAADELPAWVSPAGTTQRVHEEQRAARGETTREAAES